MSDFVTTVFAAHRGRQIEDKDTWLDFADPGLSNTRAAAQICQNSDHQTAVIFDQYRVIEA